MHSIPGRRLILALFLIFLLLPIYWLVNMSFKTNSEIVSTMTLWPHPPTLAALPAHLHRRELVFRLHQFAGICRHQHHSLDLRGAAGGLRVLALSLPRRQASVLLAVVEPHGAGRGLSRCRSSISIPRSACSIRPGRWRSRIASSTSRSRSGSSKASSPACRARSTRPPSSTAIPSLASS